MRPLGSTLSLSARLCGTLKQVPHPSRTTSNGQWLLASRSLCTSFGKASFPHQAAKLIRPYRQRSLTTQTSPVFSTPQEPRLSLTFTCTVPECDHRSTHQFSNRAYERGLVIIQCPNCKNRHLIADNIGWFKDNEETQGGKLRNIEAFMKAKGENVTRGALSDNGDVFEYVGTRNE